MRAAIGTQTIFKAVLIFTFIFVAFITIAINYNKAYKFKNETIAIIEKYEGINNQTLKIINNYLKNNGYSNLGNCDKNEYGVANLDSPKYEVVKSNNKYYYCLSSENNNNKNKIFYNIKLFSKFNLPFFGDIFNFKITGRTKDVKYYSELQKIK